MPISCCVAIVNNRVISYALLPLLLCLFSSFLLYTSTSFVRSQFDVKLMTSHLSSCRIFSHHIFPPFSSNSIHARPFRPTTPPTAPTPTVPQTGASYLPNMNTRRCGGESFPSHLTLQLCYCPIRKCNQSEYNYIPHLSTYHKYIHNNNTTTATTTTKTTTHMLFLLGQQQQSHIGYHYYTTTTNNKTTTSLNNNNNHNNNNKRTSINNNNIRLDFPISKQFCVKTDSSFKLRRNQQTQLISTNNKCFGNFMFRFNNNTITQLDNNNNSYNNINNNSLMRQRWLSSGCLSSLPTTGLCCYSNRQAGHAVAADKVGEEQRGEEQEQLRCGRQHEENCNGMQTAAATASSATGSRAGECSSSSMSTTSTTSTSTVCDDTKFVNKGLSLWKELRSQWTAATPSPPMLDNILYDQLTTPTTKSSKKTIRTLRRDNSVGHSKVKPPLVGLSKFDQEMMIREQLEAVLDATKGPYPGLYIQLPLKYVCSVVSELWEELDEQVKERERKLEVVKQQRRAAAAAKEGDED
eukprot:GHVS01024288.1.p1 GENE.GHVS01024288.1~~GHVS01024288.1.p1  ORF type:complete len:522 (+),score=145.48 GHVS01024288.1:334-1899(+)